MKEGIITQIDLETGEEYTILHEHLVDDSVVRPALYEMRDRISRTVVIGDDKYFIGGRVTLGSDEHDVVTGDPRHNQAVNYYVEKHE